MAGVGTVQFRVLGPLEVLVDGRLAALGAAKQRLVLAALLADANAVVSLDRLIDILWGEAPPQSAHGTVQGYIYRLRGAIEPRRGPGDPAATLLTRPPGYLLEVAPGQLDAIRFTDLLCAARRQAAGGELAQAATLLDEALGLWRGPAWAEFAELDFARAEVARVDGQRAAATEDRAEIDLALGRHSELISGLEATAASYPLRERPRAQLMLALYRAGRQAEALRAYQAFRSYLIEEVGLEPSAALQRLEDAIVLSKPELDWTGTGDDARGLVLVSRGAQATPAALRSPPNGPLDGERAEVVSRVSHFDLPGESPPLRLFGPPRGNVPRQMTTFVGREHELETIGSLVRERPLVTLTGVGGVGKTRLALQVAAEVVEDFADGAWLCELAPIGDPEAVWETLAANVGIVPAPGRDMDEVVLEYLGPKRLILLLDNCEHLVGAVARVIAAILRRCPGVSVLSTSREGLAMAGEQMVQVPPLGVPPASADREELAGFEAVRLFCDRVHDATSRFVLDEHNAGAVGELCRRLDGLPLAIELAAARVRSLSPQDLVARLDQRFKLLTRGSPASVGRHQTLRTTIDWSYDLLTDTERTALNRLSVFAGGCDLAAAESVLGGDLEAGDAVEALSQLVDKSLVVVDHDPRGSRYHLLETIRQYGRDRLEDTGETASVRSWHLDHFVGLAETAAPHLRSRDQLAWADTLAPDLDNFRAALDYAVGASLPDPALRLVAALTVPGLPIGWTAMGWADAAASIPVAATHPLFPLVLAYAGQNATLAGDFERAGPMIAQAEEAQAALGTHHVYLDVSAGTLALFRGDLGQAQYHAELSVEQARTTGDRYEIANALLLLGSALQNDPVRASGVAEEAVRVAREAGLVAVLPLALTTLLMFVGDDRTRELALHQEIIDVATALDDHRLVASTVASRDETRAREGDWATALRVNVDAAEHYRDGGNIMSCLALLRSAAMALTAMEHLEPAAVILGYADTHGPRWANSEEYLTLSTSTDTALLDALGEGRLAELKARGNAFNLSDAIDFLRTEADRALAGEPKLFRSV
jgi:predicted ATPase/DNA-binding SARP family transcriptional activator